MRERERETRTNKSRKEREQENSEKEKQKYWTIQLSCLYIAIDLNSLYHTLINEHIDRFVLQLLRKVS